MHQCTLLLNREVMVHQVTKDPLDRRESQEREGLLELLDDLVKL